MILGFSTSFWITIAANIIVAVVSSWWFTRTALSSQDKFERSMQERIQAVESNLVTLSQRTYNEIKKISLHPPGSL